MRLNEATLIEGSRTVLVPYKEHHVIRYNDWMQSAELQQLTASEPLTLQQEYEMQKSWHLDETKCTFIILELEKWDDVEYQEIDCMCGDVNLYFLNTDDRDAEIEIMIAEPSCRRKGIGQEALLLMMQYGVTKLQVSRFVAKIGLQNQPSLSLFKKLGFEEESVSEVFNEVTLQFQVTEKVQDLLSLQTKHMRYRHYKPK
ncbi:N-acetyltransferase 9-like protein isoform X1 [Patiria miniata]|uniref:N-acetyltransferase 9-like protein n=1 Tax=Patiria miniata TaxID=46514 RepID=A0A914AL21_PATMI|nr:N-acetyltransferase 9-like protein isoform X1 [Patiria miniata]